MIENLKQFEDEVKKITLVESDKVPTMIRWFMLEVLRRVVLATPVDTGHARHNWQLAIGSGARKEIPGKDKSGQPTIAKGTNKILATDPFSNFYLSNNVPYIEVLEYGLFQPSNPGPSRDKRKDRKGRILVKDGFSMQAPRGMVRVVFNDMIKGLQAWQAKNGGST